MSLAIWQLWPKREKAITAFRTAMAESSCDSGDSTIAGRSIDLCNRAIVSGLDNILSASAVEACRNNRVFETLYAGYDAFKKEIRNGRNYEYLNYLWEAGLRITEQVRIIAVSQGLSLTMAEKETLSEIRDEMQKISQAEFTETEGLRSKADRVKETVYAHIRRYSGLMTHNDYRDGSPKYAYLLLLQALHTYLLSMLKVA